MDIAQRIKDYRIFSILMTIFTCYCLVEALDWIYDLSKDNPTVQQTALATAVLSALVALVKFSYTFAMGDSKKLPPKE